MNRRGFITGVAALFCAPAIARASSLMPVRAPKLEAAPLLATPGDKFLMHEIDISGMGEAFDGHFVVVQRGL